MICRKCAAAAATYHVTSTERDGIKRELHLCQDCARMAGFLEHFTPSVSEFLKRLGAGPYDPGYTVRPAAPFACQLCTKGHASIHLFESKDGYEREAHLCEACGTSAATALDSVFADFPDEPAPSADPRPVCPECGQIRFDFGKIGTEVRSNLQFSMLPVRILLRGCAWYAP